MGRPLAFEMFLHLLPLCHGEVSCLGDNAHRRSLILAPSSSSEEEDPLDSAGEEHSTLPSTEFVPVRLSRALTYLLPSDSPMPRKCSDFGKAAGSRKLAAARASLERTAMRLEDGRAPGILHIN